MSFQVLTLVSGSYVHAAAALINSLQLHGFKGEIIVGHSGELTWRLSPSAPVKVVRIKDDHSKWISNLKPSFLLQHARGPFAFIDADCIVGSAKLFDVIAENIATCPLLSVEALMPSSDHRRHIWRHVAMETIGAHKRGASFQAHGRDHYYNGGFLCGQAERDGLLLVEWEKMIGTIKGFGAMEEDPRFPMSDQDCLNAVIQDRADTVASICPPDVWYAASPPHPFFHLGSTGVPLLLHCTGRDKPWLRREVPPRGANIYELQWARLVAGVDPWARSEVKIPRVVDVWLSRTLEGRLRQRAAAFLERARHAIPS